MISGYLNLLHTLLSKPSRVLLSHSPPCHPNTPALRCLFCHTLFGSRKAVYDHCDYFILQYCAAYNVKIRQQGNAYHPLVIRCYIRSGLNCNCEIKCELDASVVPKEGVRWTSAISTVSHLPAHSHVATNSITELDKVGRDAC